MCADALAIGQHSGCHYNNQGDDNCKLYRIENQCEERSVNDFRRGSQRPCAKLKCRNNETKKTGRLQMTNARMALTPDSG